MRLRNVSDAPERLAVCPQYIRNPEQWQGRWNAYFGNDHDIQIEIGSGKGQFMTALATANPHINYIAIEKYATVLLQFIKKIPESGLPNLAVISMNAEELEKSFIPDEIAGIYLNFSDPWPKKRHTNRRLTSPPFLALYSKVMKDGGFLAFKTDNRGLFDYALESLATSAFHVTDYTYDLYNSPMLTGNIKTEYEERFLGQGTPINKLTAQLMKGRKQA